MLWGKIITLKIGLNSMKRWMGRSMNGVTVANGTEKPAQSLL